MAKCLPIIVLDKAESTYAPGEPIRGHVEVQVTDECKCDGLDVSFAYHTHGKGNKNVKRLTTKRLFEGTWSPGQQYTYPFEIITPAAPLRYAGTLLNVDHRVEVSADIPWAIDPRHELPITVVPQAVEGLEVKWSEDALNADGGAGCFITSLLLTLGALGAGGTAFFAQEDDMLSVVFPLLFFGLLGLAVSMPKLLAERKLGEVRMSLRKGGGGGYRETSDDRTLYITVHARASAPVVASTVTFQVLERVVRGSGTNKRTHQHVLHEEEIPLEHDGEGNYRGRLMLPEAGRFPYSFNAPSNKIVWKLDTRVAMNDWPDWTHLIQLTAEPERVR